MKFEGLNALACIEGAKGILAVLVATGVHALVGQDLHQITEQTMIQWGVSPMSHYPQSILGMIDKISHNSLILVTLIALLYASFRFIMAYGLWNKFRWTQWFAFISGSLYIPFELYAIYEDQSLVNFSILIFNLIVVGYLYWELKRGTKAQQSNQVSSLP